MRRRWQGAGGAGLEAQCGAPAPDALAPFSRVKGWQERGTTQDGLSLGTMSPEQRQTRGSPTLRTPTPCCTAHVRDSVPHPDIWGDQARFLSPTPLTPAAEPVEPPSRPTLPSRRGCCSVGRSAACPRTAPAAGSASAARSTSASTPRGPSLTRSGACRTDTPHAAERHARGPGTWTQTPVD